MHEHAIGSVVEQAAHTFLVLTGEHLGAPAVRYVDHDATQAHGFVGARDDVHEAARPQHEPALRDDAVLDAVALTGAHGRVAGGYLPGVVVRMDESFPDRVAGQPVGQRVAEEFDGATAHVADGVVGRRGLPHDGVEAFDEFTVAPLAGLDDEPGRALGADAFAGAHAQPADEEAERRERDEGHQRTAGQHRVAREEVARPEAFEQHEKTDDDGAGHAAGNAEHAAGHADDQGQDERDGRHPGQGDADQLESHQDRGRRHGRTHDRRPAGRQPLKIHGRRAGECCAWRPGCRSRLPG